MNPVQALPLRVMVVEDHPMVREAIADALSAEPDIVVIGQVGDGRTAVSEALRLRPDVVVMDLFLPLLSGIEAIGQIKAALPDTQVLALTSATDEALFLAAMQAGATGYLVKDSERSALLEAVRQVAGGATSVSPRMVAKLVAYLNRQTVRQADPLSEREREVLRLIGGGATNVQIAQQLGLSGSTVRTHLQHILDKLHLENRNQAVLYAIRTGLVTPSE
jgi:DNA-binding NarL/FixJ family response regulator